MFISEKMKKVCRKEIENTKNSGHTLTQIETRNGKSLSSVIHCYGSCSVENVLVLLYEIDMLRGVDPDVSEAKKMLDEIHNDPLWSENVRRKFDEEFAKLIV